MSDTQVCSCCFEELPYTKEFFLGSSARREDWLGKQCRKCTLTKNRKYMTDNKEKYYSAYKEYYNSSERIEFRKTSTHKYQTYLRSMKYKYGTSEQDIRDMQDSQKGCCAICKQSLELPSIDHCHTTGKVRGLLCQHCNVLIGMSKDNINTIQNAIKYLEDSKNG